MKKLISIITPTFNEEKNIEKLSNAIAIQMQNQDYDYEQIIIDNASTDNTQSIIRALCLKNKKVKVKTNQDIKCVDQKEHAEEKKYNGWANYETWNVSLWINNNEQMYAVANDSSVKNYRDFVRLAKSLGITQTGDGVKFNDKKVFYIEIDDMIKEMKEGV